MINGPELMTSILGESEAGVQAIYIAARAIAPTVVFIDEVDAFAPARSGMSSTGGGSASDTSGRVLSTLLVEMQGTPSTAGQSQPYAAIACEGGAFFTFLLWHLCWDCFLSAGPHGALGRRFLFSS